MEDLIKDSVTSKPSFNNVTIAATAVDMMNKSYLDDVSSVYNTLTSLLTFTDNENVYKYNLYRLLFVFGMNESLDCNGKILNIEFVDGSVLSLRVYSEKCCNSLRSMIQYCSVGDEQNARSTRVSWLK